MHTQNTTQHYFYTEINKTICDSDSLNKRIFYMPYYNQIWMYIVHVRVFRWDK